MVHDGNKAIQVKKARNRFIRKLLYFDKDEERICIRCKKTKTNKDFYYGIIKNSRGHKGFRIRTECKACIRSIVKKSFRKNYHHNLKLKRIAYRKNHRFKNIKTQYGIDKVQYEEMVRKTNRVCPICLNTINKIVIDHCHTTGNVRGILCFQCNLGLGNFKDDIGSLNRAIKYLEKSVSGTTLKSTT